MDQDHALSQEDIDALFKSQSAGAHAAAPQARLYDFRRSDRIPKEQMRALRAVHDTFARSLASSLSAYLRTYVTVNLISVEQLSFHQFTGMLPSPTCISTLRMTPFEGVAILELAPALAFPLIEVLLGGGKMKPTVVEREMTTIEQQVLESLLTLILQNLTMAWQSVAKVDFAVTAHETEPALLHVLPPNEAIVVIATEVQLAETSGMMNIGLPSNIVKLLRQKFDQQWAARRAAIGDNEGALVLQRIGAAPVDFHVRTPASSVDFATLLALREGDVLQFDNTIRDPLICYANGRPKWTAKLVASGQRKGAIVDGAIEA